jgi:Golgi phosphoprotein 3 GPP34
MPGSDLLLADEFFLTAHNEDGKALLSERVLGLGLAAAVLGELVLPHRLTDAQLAVLAALRLDADRLPEPGTDGDREALRILARRASGAHRGEHRADQPAACPAAGR